MPSLLSLESLLSAELLSDDDDTSLPSDELDSLSLLDGWLSLDDDSLDGELESLLSDDDESLLLSLDGLLSDDSLDPDDTLDDEDELPNGPAGMQHASPTKNRGRMPCKSSCEPISRVR